MLKIVAIILILWFLTVVVKCLMHEKLFDYFFKLFTFILLRVSRIIIKSSNNSRDELCKDNQMQETIFVLKIVNVK